MKRAIGCIVVYEDPAEGPTALLQIRGEDSYPGCVEKTWGGGVHANERFSQALCREFREEGGECMRRACGEKAALPQALTDVQKEETAEVMTDEPQEPILDQREGRYTLHRLHVYRQEGRKLIITLLCEVHDLSLVATVQPMIDAGVLLRFTARELDRLIPISEAMKKTGIPEEEKKKGKLGMRPDEIEAVTKALIGRTRAEIS